MPGRANDLIEIPATLWQRAEMTKALRERDIGRVFERIADGLRMPSPARTMLGLAPRASVAFPASPPLSSPGLMPARNGPLATDPTPMLRARTVDRADGEEDAVRRRTFVSLTGASLFGAVLATTGPGGLAEGVEAFAAFLAGYSPDAAGEQARGAVGLEALSRAVARAKDGYQACRYADVIDRLPSLLTGVRVACAELTGDKLCLASTLSAEAHHVAASILLKLGDHVWRGWPPTGAFRPREPAETRSPLPPVPGSSRTR